MLPPGDLRMALVSLCDNSEWSLTWRDLMQLRLDTDGPLDGHALGNLLIVGLWQMFEDPVVGLDWLGRLLDSHGRVLPMSSVPLRIEATVREGDHTWLLRLAATHGLGGEALAGAYARWVQGVRAAQAKQATSPAAAAQAASNVQKGME